MTVRQEEQPGRVCVTGHACTASLLSLSSAGSEHVAPLLVWGTGLLTWFCKQSWKFRGGGSSYNIFYVFFSSVLLFLWSNLLLNFITSVVVVVGGCRGENTVDMKCGSRRAKKFFQHKQVSSFMVVFWNISSFRLHLRCQSNASGPHTFLFFADAIWQAALV